MQITLDEKNKIELLNEIQKVRSILNANYPKYRANEAKKQVIVSSSIKVINLIEIMLQKRNCPFASLNDLWQVVACVGLLQEPPSSKTIPQAIANLEQLATQLSGHASPEKKMLGVFLMTLGILTILVFILTMAFPSVGLMLCIGFPAGTFGTFALLSGCGLFATAKAKGIAEEVNVLASDTRSVYASR